MKELICCIFRSLRSKDNSTLKHAMNDGKVNLLIVTSLKINTTVTVDVELRYFWQRHVLQELYLSMSQSCEEAAYFS